jgi:hypothetical protein
VPVRHIYRPGAEEKAIDALERKLKRPLTPSHRRLLRMSNGCSLFTDCSRRRVRGDTGLVLYSIKQIVRENIRFHDQMGDSAAAADRLVVGEPAGFGNWIAIDYRRTSKLGEPPIIYVDHEGGDADGRLVADSFEHLFRKLEKDPLPVFRKELDDSVVYEAKRGHLLQIKQSRAD